MLHYNWEYSWIQLLLVLLLLLWWWWWCWWSVWDIRLETNKTKRPTKQFSQPKSEEAAVLFLSLIHI